MEKFYLSNLQLLLVCLMMDGAAIIVQTLSVTCGFRRLKQQGRNLAENLLESAVLLQLFLLALMLARIGYYASRGFVCGGGYEVCRYGMAAVLTILSVGASWEKRLFWPMTIPLIAVLTLPAAEKTGAENFGIFFVTALVLWLIRCSYVYFLRRQEQKHQLSELSVKEAIDTMDAGLLFCQSRGPKDGQVILFNSRMQELMLTLTGNFYRSGKNFYEDLLAEKVLPECKKGELGDQLAYWLPNQSLWVFDLHVLMIHKKRMVLLVATDNTQRWKAAKELWQQNDELAKKNRELKEMMAKLETICKTEETIRAKSRVHDVLGQKISLLLRAMREHREPSEVLLSSFAQGLPKELTEVMSSRTNALDTLVEVFQGLGVEVVVHGNLPQNEHLANTFSEIAAEAVTNAVRHGYAAQVNIDIAEKNKTWTMDIVDSGLPLQEPVTEGGGLTSMRRKTEALGGSFSYCVSPHFHLHIVISEEE